MIRFLPTRVVAMLFVGMCLSAQAMENGGLEKGLEGWGVNVIPAASAEVLKEAASMGEFGLRLKIASQPTSGEIISPKIEVAAGKSYLAKYWSGGGGAQPANASIEMVFFDEHGNALPPPVAPAGKKARTAATGGANWNPGELAAVAPENAHTLGVRIKPMSGPPGSAVDFDDLTIDEMPASSPVSPLPVDSPRIQELKAEIQRDPTRGKTPPKIVLKLDDLKPASGGTVSQQWLRVADFAKEKNIKISVGIIAEGLEPDSPAFIQWIQEENAAKRIEFWNHGWDHAAGEKMIREFSGQPYERQKDHFSRANEIARKKLGFAFTSFGAPFNITDAATVRMLTEEPTITVWLYGDPKNPAGKIVLGNGVVTIETRARPDFEAFLEAYAHNRGTDYFVMQGHPGGWKDDNFEQFRMMVDFLIDQKAQFVFPRDFIVNNRAIHK